jgi:ClpP class serine protease
MKFLHLLSRVTGTPWLITPDALDNITLLLQSRFDGQALAAMPPRAALTPSPTLAPGTAVIPIHGVIGKRLSAMEMACGGCDVGELATAFAAANADPAVSRIVLHIDSPGGTVTGVPELAAMIYDTKQKPVEAVTDTLIGSAAYWIAAAADSITATPSAQVGSIGAVLQVRETIDPTSADGRTRLRVFRSGEDKFAGADAPLTAAQATAYQGTVDTIGELFRSSVTEARPRIAGESMTGRVYLGNEAMARGLVDNVVAALPDYFAAPSAQAAAPTAQAAAPAPAAAPAAQTFNITLPAMTFGAPTVNVDARMEKDSIRVEQSQTTSGAKKIERDAKGTVTGVIDAPA